MIYLESSGTNFGFVFSNDSEYSIVAESISDINGIVNLIKFVDVQVKSLHVVYPEALEVNKKRAPLRNIRKGWERVKVELQLVGAKRVLVLADSADLFGKVIMQGLETGDLQYIHGTLFELDGMIVVPTWNLNDYEHRNKWFARDIKRWEKLNKPSNPLEYTTEFKFSNSISELVIDLETTGLDATVDTITALGLRYKNNRVVVTENISKALSVIIRLAKETNTQFWFHNAQFDMGFLGQEFINNVLGKVHCTLIRAKASGELVANLKHLASYHTNRPGCYAWHVNGEHFTFDDPRYLCEDIESTWLLAQKFKEYNSPVIELMEQAIVMAADQTSKGSKIDEQLLSSLDSEIVKARDALEIKLTEDYGVHPGKTQELVNVLKDRGYRLFKFTEGGNYALDEEVLTELNLHDILEYRKLVKMSTSFVGKISSLLRVGGYLPHSQNMLGADTGRSTMSNFNWQQAGKKGPVKRLLVSRFEDGFIGNVDLSAAELITAAYVSNDKVFANVLMDSDPHTANAARAFNITKEEVRKDVERKETKTITFRILYGGSAENDEQERVKSYFSKEFTVLMKWLSRVKYGSIENKYVVDSWGKKRNLEAVYDYRGKWGVGRAGVNSPIQGSASHIAICISLTLYKLFKKHNLKSIVLFGVHDSTVTDIHPDEVDIVIELHKQAFKTVGIILMDMYKLASTLPLKGELLIGKSWAHVEELNEYFDKSIEKVVLSTHG